jgi:hypothetical protein
MMTSKGQRAFSRTGNALETRVGDNAHIEVAASKATVPGLNPDYRYDPNHGTQMILMSWFSLECQVRTIRAEGRCWDLRGGHGARGHS